MLFREQSLWTWLISSLTFVSHMESVMEPSTTVWFPPTPVSRIHTDPFTSPTPPPRLYRYPPMVKRAVTGKLPLD
jgi:hypothetical protein